MKKSRQEITVTQIVPRDGFGTSTKRTSIIVEDILSIGENGLSQTILNFENGESIKILESHYELNRLITTRNPKRV